MPTYTPRTLAEYPTEFYRCPANPEGNEFICVFCMQDFKTSADRKSHMEECAIEVTGEEFDEDYMIEDESSISDILHDHEVVSHTVKALIVSDELRRLAHNTSAYIQEHIKTILINNGICRPPSKQLVFQIYRFFFEVSIDEWKIVRKEFCDEISAHVHNNI